MDGSSGVLADMNELAIWEPIAVKEQTFKTAIEVSTNRKDDVGIISAVIYLYRLLFFCFVLMILFLEVRREAMQVVVVHPQLWKNKNTGYLYSYNIYIVSVHLSKILHRIIRDDEISYVV